MSSTLYTAVPLLTGDNYFAWAQDMEAYLRASGCWYPFREKRPTGGSPPTAEEAKLIKEWDDVDDKAMGQIKLRSSASIKDKVSACTTAREIWDLLAGSYGEKGLGGIFNDFDAAMAVQIPSNAHPSKAIDEIAMYFSRLDKEGVKIPDFVQAMIIRSKLPSRYDFVKQSTAQAKKSTLETEVTVTSVQQMARLAYEGSTSNKNSHASGSKPQANKLTVVKRKANDPGFQQQQKKPQQGNQNNGNGDSSKKKNRKRGKGKGKGKESNESNMLDFAPMTSVFDAGIKPSDAPLAPSVPDPRRHSILPTVKPSGKDLPIHRKTKRAIALARVIGAVPTAETIRTLEKKGPLDMDWEEYADYCESIPDGPAVPTPIKLRPFPAGVSHPVGLAKIEEVYESDNSAGPSKRQKLADRIDWAEEVETNLFRDPTPDLGDFGILPEIPKEDTQPSPVVSLGDDYDPLFDEIVDSYGLVTSSFPFQATVTDASTSSTALTCRSMNRVRMSCTSNFSVPEKYILPEPKCSHSSTYNACKKCKGKESEHRHVHRDSKKLWLNDSGASQHTTFDKSDFIEFNELSEKIPVGTATTVAWITGIGTVLITVKDYDGSSHHVRLSDVYYMEKLRVRLLSQGQLLQAGMALRGNSHWNNFWDNDKLFLSFVPRSPGDTLYVIEDLSPREEIKFIGNLVVDTIDYKTMHRRMGHPSPDVLKQLRKHVKDSPVFDTLKEDEVCEGCAKGKMTLRPFPPTTRRANRPFEIIHSDLKELPTLSYHKYKYTVVFFDDYTSFGWCTHLRTKKATLPALKHFIALVKTQFGAQVAKWMSDSGGEFHSTASK